MGRTYTLFSNGNSRFFRWSFRPSCTVYAFSPTAAGWSRVLLRALPDPDFAIRRSIGKVLAVRGNRHPIQPLYRKLDPIDYLPISYRIGLNQMIGSHSDTIAFWGERNLENPTPIQLYRTHLRPILGRPE